MALKRGIGPRIAYLNVVAPLPIEGVGASRSIQHIVSPPPSCGRSGHLQIVHFVTPMDSKPIATILKKINIANTKKIKHANGIYIVFLFSPEPLNNMNRMSDGWC
ncbi:hypothetical protein [Burkholderia ubonensis]|uniref:hypothetical protein n=1 Tax=Burkholderia ubonensis TaxID=101571 RepID=UPI0012F8D337|nr:hypothetical protein [Burkholderia ubonensis]